MLIPIKGKYRISGHANSPNEKDYAVNVGTPVYATVGGVVKRADFITRKDGSPSYGNAVFLNSGKQDHIFAHLRNFTVAPGQRVKAGEIIGYSGNTGNSSGPHLHYEVRGSGNYKSPYDNAPRF